MSAATAPAKSAPSYRHPIRELFPTLNRTVGQRPLVYLDSAATSLRPSAVIDAGCRFCRDHDANPHRGIYTLSAEATEAYEATRTRVSDWLKAPSPDGVVFTRNATAAINLVARGMEHRLKPGDEVLLTEMEHHANLVPWIVLAKRLGITLRHIPIAADGTLNLSALPNLLSDRTRIVSLTYVSNVLGTINPVREIAEAAHRRGALVLLDAAQAVGHISVSFEDLGVDLLAFSAHKCYGPAGLGLLIGTEQALEQLEPLETGGEMIESVTLTEASWAPIPHRFEAGTANAPAVVGFNAAIAFIEQIGIDVIRQHDIALTEIALSRLAEIPDLEVLGPRRPDYRTGLISFVAQTMHPHDLATVLDEHGVAVRAGHHCAQPLHKKLGIPASTRASFGVYSTNEDIDALIEGIVAARKVFAQ